MHLILTGATGLVGSAVLDAMMNMTQVSRISILSRRPVSMAEASKDPRVNVILHHDFARYDPNVLAQLKGARGCVWALGTGQNMVTKEEYVKITTTYAVKAAEAFANLASENTPFQFIFVSGEGATIEPGPFTPPYSRVKGETEMALAELRKAIPRLHTNAMRPGFVDWVDHEAIKPYISPRPMLKQTAITVLGPVYRAALPGRCSPSKPLGVFLAEMALGEWEEQIAGEGFQKMGNLCVVSNAEFRKLTRLDS